MPQSRAPSIADDMLMGTKAQRIDITARVLEPDDCVIGNEDNAEAIEALGKWPSRNTDRNRRDPGLLSIGVKTVDQDSTGSRSSS